MNVLSQADYQAADGGLTEKDVAGNAQFLRDMYVAVRWGVGNDSLCREGLSIACAQDRHTTRHHVRAAGTISGGGTDVQFRQNTHDALHGIYLCAVTEPPSMQNLTRNFVQKRSMSRFNS